MKLTAQQVFIATPVIRAIIEQNRPMPQKGKYRLARMSAKLEPEFKPINDRREAMIIAYDYHPMVKTADGAMEPAPHFGVPEDKLAEFLPAWKEIGDEEIEVDVEPVPLAYLDFGDNANGSISAAELVALGDLVRE